jgi:hypothetical protein
MQLLLFTQFKLIELWLLNCLTHLEVNLFLILRLKAIFFYSIGFVSFG